MIFISYLKVALICKLKNIDKNQCKSLNLGMIFFLKINVTFDNQFFEYLRYMLF